MGYEEMRQMEKTHICVQCDSPLVTIWNDNFGEYALVCAHNHQHHGYKRRPTPYDALARGGADNVLGPGAQKDLEKMAAAGAPALSRLSEKDIATNEVIPRDKLLALVEWGTRLGLKPYLGHVCLYFGKPYITIDGYYYLLNKSESGMITGTRPLNPEERQSYQIAEGDIAFIAEAWTKEQKLSVTGLGIVTREEIEGKSTRRPEEFRAPVVHSHPQRMAEKRAEWQLLRKLIPLEEKDALEKNQARD